MRRGAKMSQLRVPCLGPQRLQHIRAPQSNHGRLYALSPTHAEPVYVCGYIY